MQLVCQSILLSTAEVAVEELSAADGPVVDVMFGSADHFDVADPDQVAKLRTAFEESGLRVSVHCEFGENMDLSSLDQKARQEAIDKHIRQIEIAAQLGAEIACVHPGTDSEDAERPACLEAAAQGMGAIMPAAERAGIDIAFENLPPDYIGDNQDELMQLVTALESPRARICMDTGHCHVAGIPQSEMLAAFAGNIALIHWHDNSGEEDEHLIPGLGTIDWSDFFDGVQAMDYDGPVMLEAPRGEMPVPEFVRLGQLALNERRPLFV